MKTMENQMDKILKKHVEAGFLVGLMGFVVESATWLRRSLVFSTWYSTVLDL